MQNNTKGYIYGCLSAVSYGMNPLCALKLYEDGFTPASVLVYRFLFATILLGLFMVFQHRTFSVKRSEMPVLALLGGLFALSSMTYFIAFKYMSAGVAATLVFSYPIMVALIMALFFHEKQGLLTWCAIGLSVIGVSLLSNGDNGSPIATVGMVCILISALSYALYIVVINRSHIKMSSLKLTFYAMLVCLACIIGFIPLSGAGVIQPLLSASEWFYAVFLGLVPTVISLVFMAMAVKLIGSTSTAVMGALEPVTAVVIGMTIFGELMTLRLAIGIVLILTAVTVIVARRKR